MKKLTTYNNKLRKRISLLLIAFTLPICIFAQTTINKKIVSGNDDIEENYSGNITTSNTILYLGYNGNTNRNNTVGLRFTNLSIPQGVTITNAYIRFYARNSSSGTVQLSIAAHNTDNAPVFQTSRYSLTNLPKTISVDGWLPPSWNDERTYNTPDISSVVQEIINRTGWKSGNNISFIINEEILSDKFRTAASFEEKDDDYGPARLYVTYVNCSPQILAPVFALGQSSNRCPIAENVIYKASSTGSTGMKYSISNTGTGTQPTINAVTGEVTYAANWSGTSTITATATGCGGNKSSTHTVTTAPQVASPVFSTVDNTRCSIAGTVVYSATSSNAESISYSISNTGTGTQPTINSATGQVTYAANWSGTTIITATATGCSTTSFSTFTVNTRGVYAVADEATGQVGTPLIINVLNNDLCNADPTTLSLATPPANGTIQLGTGGELTYLPNGNFSGTDTFVYQVCTGPSGECSQAIVTVKIIDDGSNTCSNARFPHTYYLPFPENADLKKSLRSAGKNDDINNVPNARRIISIKANYSNTIIYYDHWEDGYEAIPGTKTQTTTQIWGDGDTSNGVAPGYETTDIIPEGAIITIEDSLPYRTGNGRATSESVIQFDGRDKIYSSKMLTISKVTGSEGAFVYQNLKTNVIDLSRFGELFVIPFGENISTLSNPTIETSAFRYVGVFVRASENGTIVKLDYDGNGTIDITSPTLSEGQVWFYDGTAATPGNIDTDINKSNDIKVGAVITSNKPIGVDLVFGGIDYYGTRNIPVLPGKYYGDTYYSPVHTTNTTSPVYAVFYNSLNEPITLNWKNGLGETGTLILPAKGYNSKEMNQATGYKFQSTNGKSYTAVTIIDAGEIGSAYDWAFNMIPGHQLTNFTSTAWAPGKEGNGMANPIWVTPVESTTVYVKYNGSVMTGAGSTSPCGLKYDAAYPLSALQSQRIGIAGGNDGMSIFTCDGTLISAVYGQDAGVAETGGSNTLDVGFTLDPQCMDFTIFANNDYAQTMPEIPVIIKVLDNDIGGIDPSSLDITTNPFNGTVVVNPDRTVTYTPNSGFTGTDSFSYQICQYEDGPCVTAVVTVDVGCYGVEWKHMVSGKVFADDDNNGTLDTNESGWEHTVNLYLDTNGNGILDTTETTPLQSITTGANGVYVFSIDTPAAGTQATDNFSSGNYSGGTGWAGNWIEEYETTDPKSGNIRVVSEELRFTGDVVSAIKRSISSPITNAILSFDYRTENMDGLPAEKLTVQVSSTSSGPWTELGSLHSITGFSSGSKSYNIPTSLVGPGMTIRFSTEGIDGDYFYVDNIKILSIPTVNYLVGLAQPLPKDMFQTLPVDPQINYAFSLNGFESRCSMNFGLGIEYACTKPATTGTPAGYTNVGITVQQKQAAWPENIPNGWIALESKEKGMVITRVQNSDAVSEAKEGMLIYDIDDQCVKLYNGTEWNCIEKSCNE